MSTPVCKAAIKSASKAAAKAAAKTASKAAAKAAAKAAVKDAAKPASKPTSKSAAKATVERKANRRGAARLAAVQALYQMDVAAKGLNEIFAEFESHWMGQEVEGTQYRPAEAAFFRDIVAGVVREQRELDPMIDRALAGGWPLKRVEALMRALLRAGIYELCHRRDVPGRVVISEYVDVANAFFERDETGMVNAVLDELGRRLRADEFAAPRDKTP
jgi:N utilization substance protein B